MEEEGWPHVPQTFQPFWGGWKKVARFEGSLSVLRFAGTHNQQSALESICPQGEGDKNAFSIIFIVIRHFELAQEKPEFDL